jgi:hypothetical protein
MSPAGSFLTHFPRLSSAGFERKQKARFAPSKANRPVDMDL